MPVELVIAHAQQESNQNYLGVGAAGEYGLWQFMPATWAMVMGAANWKDVVNQCTAYVKHSRGIINTYRLNLNNTGDIRKYLWIWNAGSGNYEKGILPASTKLYIMAILSYKGLVWL